MTGDRPIRTFSLNPDDVADLDRIRIADDSCFDLEQLPLLERDRRKRRPFAPAVRFHHEHQDVESDGWRQLLDVIDEAADDGRELFWPIMDLGPERMTEILELPPAISKLTSVTHVRLYGSNLVRFPPEIAQMQSLVELDAYRSYRLHWFPFEIVRCRELRESRISTRALYGNVKYRWDFPDLDEEDPSEWVGDGTCSVCEGPFEEGPPRLAWISLGIGTDVVPLLVRACSEACIESLPEPPKGYVGRPHRGGRSLIQPATR